MNRSFCTFHGWALSDSKGTLDPVNLPTEASCATVRSRSRVGLGKFEKLGGLVGASWEHTLSIVGPRWSLLEGGAK